ncbi:uncharacterized protein J7T54_001013 [Emericellopsis cladophorae]|uniref:Uncharacterized protein n=1 Tax=Emericellopsis cladophorae TaxID=2686198 RepID=A0A9P9XXB9_9HYPO|nr:uncharacterized protein J7T54_001013 [Emericellopsis cladophorae]KAI6779283.1 hypothetical protein J7T54_001013 [Emericellopsis cladophorae]
MEYWPSSDRRPQRTARICNYPDVAYKLDAASIKHSPAWFEAWGGTILGWIMVVLLTLFQAGIFAIGIAMIYTNDASIDESSPDFALYKNSRFHECVNTTPESVDCTLLQGNAIDMSTEGDEQNHFLIDMVFHDYQNNTTEHPTYTWCEVVSCLKDFKILPTTLRPSALQLPSWKTWFQCNIQAIIAAWAARTWIGAQSRKSRSACKGISIKDWGPAVYTIGATVYWWVDFIRWCTRPDYHAFVSVIEWISTWTLAYKMGYHPFSCIFKEDSRWRKVLAGILWTTTVVQWVISCYLFSRYWKEFFPPSLEFAQRYDCVQSQVASAPGQSSCTPDQLCSIPWLLTNPGWNGWSMEAGSSNFFAQYDIANIMLALLFFFSTFTFVSVPLVATATRTYAILRPDRHPERSLFGDLVYFNDEIGGPVISGAVAALVSLCFSALLLGHTPATWNSLNREGPVAYDLDCSAVHVIASPWRQYVDIEYGRALRFVRMWFSI